MINVSDTQNTTYTTEHDLRNITAIVILAVVIAIFIIFSVSGNVLVVLAVLKTPNLREEKSNFLVINLAVTDMLNGMTVMLSSFILVAMDLTDVPYVLCNMICAANYCFIIVSMMTLCLISIDRFYAIIFPLKYIEKITMNVLGIAITAVWTQGIVFSIVPIIEDWIEYDYSEITCAIQWHKKGDDAIYYVIVAFVLCFLLPGIVLAFNYIKILREAKKKMKVWSVNIQTMQDKSERKKIKKESASAKTVRSLLIIVFAFFLFMSPFSVTKLIKVSVKQPIIPDFVNSLASIFAFASSVVNPLIYGIFRKDFRQAFKRLLRRNLQTGQLSNINNIPNSTMGLETSS